MEVIRYAPMEEFKAVIERGEKGLFCKQPVDRIFNKDGYEFRRTGSGKYVFPTKNCRNKLCCGNAHVKIVKDCDKYAIAEMEMVQYESLPDDVIIKEYLVMDRREMMFTFGGNGKEIMIRRGTKKGDYIFISFPILNESHFIVYRNGRFQEIENEGLDLGDGAQSVVSKTIAAFITDMNGGTSIEEYVKDFTEFHFEDRGVQYILDTEVEDDLLDEAVTFGFINVYQGKYEKYMKLNESVLIEATEYFCKTEISDAIKKASEFNKQANENMCKMMKSAKIPFDTYG